MATKHQAQAVEKRKKKMVLSHIFVFFLFLHINGYIRLEELMLTSAERLLYEVLKDTKIHQIALLKRII